MKEAGNSEMCIIVNIKTWEHGHGWRNSLTFGIVRESWTELVRSDLSLFYRQKVVTGSLS